MSLIGSDRNEPSKLARSPFGGSLVILTPFCRMDTGNLSEGPEVSHSRNSGEVESGLMSSQIFSSVGIQVE